MISTFLMHCCRPRELVSAASGDELFRVLKTLLENIHRFLHQPLALVAEHVIIVHKFLDDDAGPLQQGTDLLLLVCTSDDLLPTTKKRHIRDILGRTKFFSVIHMTLL